MQKLILESHLWLGLCGVICTWGTFVLLHQSVSFLYLSFVLAGTMTIYSLHGFIKLKVSLNPDSTHQKKSSYSKISLMAGSFVTLVLYLLLNRISQLILILPAFMAVLYVFPIYRGKRLKDYPFIKIIAIVIAWTTITFWVPVHNISYWWDEWGYNYLFIDRILFFFALAIPFDIRDIQFDKAHALKTIPNTIGLYNSQYLALFSLFLAGGFMSMGSEILGIPSSIKSGLLVVYILLGILIIRLNDLPKPRFYSWFMDGILFLYGVVILFLSK